jgi:hypothetical protein
MSRTTTPALDMNNVVQKRLLQRTYAKKIVTSKIEDFYHKFTSIRCKNLNIYVLKNKKYVLKNF